MSWSTRPKITVVMASGSEAILREWERRVEVAREEGAEVTHLPGVRRYLIGPRPPDEVRRLEALARSPTEGTVLNPTVRRSLRRLTKNR